MADGQQTVNDNHGNQQDGALHGNAEEAKAGNPFSISIGQSENVMIGNNCTMIVRESSSQRRSNGRRKKKIPPKYPITDSNHMLNRDETIEISGKVGKCWNHLGVLLGIDNAELQQMKMDNKDDKTELNYRIITKWQQCFVERATKASLANIFIKMGRGDLADILAIRSSHS